MKRIVVLIGLVVAMIATTIFVSSCESHSSRHAEEIRGRHQILVPNADIIGRGAQHTVFMYHGDTVIIKNQFSEPIDTIGYLINVKRK